MRDTPANHKRGKTRCASFLIIPAHSRRRNSPWATVMVNAGIRRRYSAAKRVWTDRAVYFIPQDSECPPSSKGWASTYIVLIFINPFNYRLMLSHRILPFLTMQDNKMKKMCFLPLWQCLLQDVLNRRLLLKQTYSSNTKGNHHPSFLRFGIGQKKTVDAAKICGGAENVLKQKPSKHS